MLGFVICCFLLLVSVHATGETNVNALYTGEQKFPKTGANRFKASTVLGSWNCPRDCSGHGNCINDVCLCWEGRGYTGMDCSTRSCPYDLAWADKAYDIDSAHSLAECSNAGICDEGTCKCFAGFTGIACQKTTCGASDCNEHGDCLTIGEIYKRGSAQSGAVEAFTPWEANHTSACLCHNGYAGPACTQRMCPRGNDPYTNSNAHARISIKTSTTSGALTGGYFVFYFLDQSFRFEADVGVWDAAACKTSFEGLRNVDSVACSLSYNHDGGVTYVVEFKKFPVLPYMNNIYEIPADGNPSASSFGCISTLATSGGTAACTIASLTAATDRIPEYAPCSNRGLCDLGTGICKCYEGFVNANCDTYNPYLRPSTRALSRDVLEVEVTAPAYTGTVLSLTSLFDDSEMLFDWLNMSTSTKSVFTIDGVTGNINVAGSFHANGWNSSLYPSGVVVYNRGLYLGEGGIVLGVGGFVLDTGIVLDVIEVNGGVVIQNTGLIVQTEGIKLVGGMTVEDQGLRVYGSAIANAGGISVALGGVAIASGLTVAAGGLVIQKHGMTISGGGLVLTGGLTLAASTVSFTAPAGLKMNSGGLTVTGGASIYDQGLAIPAGGLTVGDSGLFITGGISINTNGLELGMQGGSGIGLTIHDSGLYVEKGLYTDTGLTISDSGLQVTGGLTMNQHGIAVTGGMTVAGPAVLHGTYSSRESLTVQTGSAVILVGININSGYYYGVSALDITGGLTTYDGGLVVAGGITIDAGGFYMAERYVKKPIEVHSGGVNLVSGRMTLWDGGLVVTGGATIKADGLILKGLRNMKVHSGGISGVDGLTVVANGLVVTGGLSASDGLAVTGGMTVRSGGAVTTQGLTLYDGGLVVTGGATVCDAGLLITGGLTVALGVFTPSSLTIANDGLSIRNDVTLQTRGLSVVGDFNARTGLSATGGLTVLQGGAIIRSGGVTVYSGGVKLDSGTLVMFKNDRAKAGLYVTGGVSVNDDFAVQAGATIFDGGVVVGGPVAYNYPGLHAATGIYVTGGVGISKDGMKIHRDGATVTGGATLLNDGLAVSGGVTVLSGGVMWAGGLTVLSSGLSVTGGVTSYTGGIVVTGGLTVHNDGFSVEGGMTVLDGGVDLGTGRLIIDHSLREGTGPPGLVIVDTGLSIQSDGLAIERRLYCYDEGLVVTGGITLYGEVGLRLTKLSVETGGMNITSNIFQVKSVGVHMEAGDLNSQNGLYVHGTSDITGVNLRGTATVYKGLESTTTYVPGHINNGVYVSGVLRNNGKGAWQSMAAGSAAYTSDRRLKEKIYYITEPLLKLRRLQGVYYYWNDAISQQGHQQTEQNETLGDAGSRFDRQRHVGLLAQEVRVALPEAVLQDVAAGLDGGEGVLGVNYEDLVPLLVESIKELASRAEQGDARNTHTHVLHTQDSTGTGNSSSRRSGCCFTELADSIETLQHMKGLLGVLREEENSLNSMLSKLENM